jgi:hypothetical protein
MPSGGACYQEALDNSSFGLQRQLVLTSWPSTNVRLRTADYPRLVDQPALADGTYYARVCVGGTSKLNLQLKATFAGGSVTTSAVTTYAPKSGLETDADLFALALQTFGSTGAMVTNTLQTGTIATMQGEQLAIVKIVVAGGAAPVFTQAEINGPR